MSESIRLGPKEKQLLSLIDSCGGEIAWSSIIATECVSTDYQLVLSSRVSKMVDKGLISTYFKKVVGSRGARNKKFIALTELGKKLIREKGLDK
ncbi:MAG: hypothetical protein QW453_06320 [Thermoprotei archaeon]